MWHMYVMRNDTNGRFYVGSTSNIDRRIKEHNESKRRSVTHFGKYYLVYKEDFLTRREAFQREKQVKSYKGGNAFKKLLREQAQIIV